MAVNTYRLSERGGKNKSFFSVFERFLRIDQTVTEVIHVKYLMQILFITILCILYIGNRHYAEKKIRNISILEQTVKDLRADYTTLKSDYMFASKQSEVALRVKSMGLKESDIPPHKIIMTE